MGDKITIFYSDSDLEKLVSGFGTNNKTDLVKKIRDLSLNPKSNEDSKSIDYEIKKEKLQELKLKNRLTLIRELKISPDIALKVSNGTIAFEEIFRPKIEKEKSAGLDDNGFCSECGHVHFSKAGNKNCTSALCLCGIRG